MVFFLSSHEIAVLFRQNPCTAHRGGFQWFLVQLQRRANINSGRIYLVPRDLERIPRYAFRYGNGGWENRLTQIFGRILGPHLNDPCNSMIPESTAREAA